MLAALVNNDHPDVLATAYAPAEPDYAKASPFEALLRTSSPTTAASFRRWPRATMAGCSTRCRRVVFSKKEQACLANGIYFEARGESVKGQAAVAQVILNRVRNPAYPKSICGVVYQNENWLNRCQFSFACDGSKDRIDSPDALQDRAGSRHGRHRRQDLHPGGRLRRPITTPTMSSPRWARTMEKMTKIGLHIFYRTYGGGWS